MQLEASRHDVVILKVVNICRDAILERAVLTGGNKHTYGFDVSTEMSGYYCMLRVSAIFPVPGIFLKRSLALSSHRHALVRADRMFEFSDNVQTNIACRHIRVCETQVDSLQLFS